MKISIGPYPKSHKTKRRVNVHIDKYDTWNMDATLALIIVPMLKQLKKTSHSFALVDDVDVPEELRSTNASPTKDPFDVDANGQKRWNWVLSEMIWAFEQCNKDWENKYHKGRIDFKHVPVDKDGNVVDEKDAKWFRLEHGPKHTATFDKEGYKKHQERMQRGYTLFGKYYHNLWD